MNYFKIFILFVISEIACAQDCVYPSVGEYAYPKRFKHVILQGGQYEISSSKATCYDRCGNEVKFSKGDTFTLRDGSFFEGTYKGISGVWAQSYVDFDGPGRGMATETYILFSDLKRTDKTQSSPNSWQETEKYRASEKQARIREETFQLWREQQEAESRNKTFTRVGIILAAGIFILVIILMRGIGSECPQCKSWWKRELLSRDLVDSSTKHGIRTVRKEVQGGSGGYVMVDEAYSTTTYTHKYHYACKKCGHKWTVTKMS